MKYKAMKRDIGDMVTVHDGSYAIRVDKFEDCCISIGGSKDIFEVVGRTSDRLRCYDDTQVHDIYIKNTISGEVYLHSAAFVTKVINPETIELNGKIYIKSELEEALRHIKPVGEE